MIKEIRIMEILENEKPFLLKAGEGAKVIDMGKENLVPTLNQLLTATCGQAGGWREAEEPRQDPPGTAVWRQSSRMNTDCLGHGGGRNGLLAGQKSAHSQPSQFLQTLLNIYEDGGE